MRVVPVSLSGGRYEIRIGASLKADLPGLLGDVGQVGRLLVVTDENVARLHPQAVSACLSLPGAAGPPHVIPPGEASKSAKELGRLWDRLAAELVDRAGFLVALGGGVVSDLTGFAAATWMRGIRWGAIPTTLEAAVDAGVGGKTAINHPAGKNLMGAFHQPSFVLLDLSLLATLPQRDRRAGLAESIKHGLIAEAGFFSWQEANAGGIVAGEVGLTEELIARNCQIKARVVAADEREEKGIREILNYGHTIGHAVERELDYELRHGECVGLGMVAAARIAAGRGMLSEAEESRIGALIGALGLPRRLPRSLSPPRIVELIGVDKKARPGRRRFVLLEGIGRCRVVADVTDAQIEAGLGAIA